jgi:hypothetical protein
VSSANDTALLDAPLVPKPPTVRSELERGHEAAFTCTLKHPLEVANVSGCVDSAQEANRQKMGQGFEAFDTGCYFTAWVHFRQVLSVILGSSDTVNLKLAQLDERLYWTRYVASRKKIGVSDSAILEALFKPTDQLKRMLSDAVSRYGDG